MPSVKPQKVIRAEQSRIDAWEQAAGGGSFNEWACAALDAAAGSVGASWTNAPAPAKTKKRTSSSECPRARFHRAGSYCKECGTTG